MKIEAGKLYKRGDGKRVRIYAVDGAPPYSIHGAVLFREGWRKDVWDKEGSSDINASEDLISEWIDRPEMDWSALPKWAKWIAMDCDGDWRWFEKVPVTGSGGWGITSGLTGLIPCCLYPKWSGDWKDSLTEVPRKD